MTEQPLITIGLITFNAADTVAAAIESALAQDWPNTEIVIVDDVSSDGTVEILKEYERKDQRIRLILLGENQGVAGARNQIIEAAQGDFICFFDDDDISVPERLTRQYERLTSYQERFSDGAPVLCHSARRQIYPDGAERIETTMGTDEDRPAPNGLDVVRRVLAGYPVPGVYGSLATCSQMGRTEDYRALGGFNQEFRRCGDTEHSLRFAKAGGHFPGIAIPLVTQAMTYGTEKSLSVQCDYFLSLFDLHKDALAKTVNPAFCRAWIKAKYLYLMGHHSAFFWCMIKIFVRHPVRTAQRLWWALPNRKLNARLAGFHQNEPERMSTKQSLNITSEAG